MKVCVHAYLDHFVNPSLWCCSLFILHQHIHMYVHTCAHKCVCCSLFILHQHIHMYVHTCSHKCVCMYTFALLDYRVAKTHRMPYLYRS